MVQAVETWPVRPTFVFVTVPNTPIPRVLAQLRPDLTHPLEKLLNCESHSETACHSRSFFGTNGEWPALRTESVPASIIAKLVQMQRSSNEQAAVVTAFADADSMTDFFLGRRRRSLTPKTD